MMLELFINQKNAWTTHNIRDRRVYKLYQTMLNNLES
jgi:hypothetical protein